ncbi:hypothetical protein ACEQ8H_004570 [Pleosporales sp. CAS-2024a]
MAKLPTPPRSMPARRALPTNSPLPTPRRPPRELPRELPRGQFNAERLLRTPEPTPRANWQRVWAERPKLSDMQQLPDEVLRSAEHQAKVNKWRQRALFGMGLVAFGLGAYGSMLYVSLTRAVPASEVPADVSDRFDRAAEGYDEKVNVSESMLLLTYKRKKLTAQAHGHVLEVAVGTGRNIPYYRTKQCATVTLVDASGPMLAVAKRKWNDTHKEYFSRVSFKQQSALEPMVPPYGAQDGFDTVLQTMGLCSTPEPVKLLQNMEACTKENGQILLLEHGKSHYEWLNGLLDKTAAAHADAHGCWWNKDIGKIVEESGLEVVEMKRYNFGTTWWLQLKPRKGKGMRQRQRRAGTGAGAGEGEGDEAPVAPAGAPVTPKRAWWPWAWWPMAMKGVVLPCALDTERASVLHVAASSKA